MGVKCLISTISPKLGKRYPVIEKNLDISIQTFEDAAVQAYFLNLRAFDNIEKEHTRNTPRAKKIWYAIDSNVIDIYVQPADRAVADTSRLIGAGEIFRADEKDRKIDICASLGVYIFFELSKSSPLLVMPPIDKEVEGSIKHFVSDDKPRPHAPPKKRLELLKELIGKKVTTIETSRELVEEIRATYLTDDSYSAQQTRMYEILKYRRMAPINTSRSHPSYSLALRKALAPITDIKEMGAHSLIKSKWEDVFKELGRGSGDSLNNDRDAMAFLEIVNRRLYSLSRGTEKVVYITNDNSIISGGEEITSSNSENTFTEDFIRHPRSFLNDEGVLRPNEVIKSQAIVGHADLNAKIDEQLPSVGLTDVFNLNSMNFWEGQDEPKLDQGVIRFNEAQKKIATDIYEKFSNSVHNIITSWQNYETLKTNRVPKLYLSRLEKHLKIDGADLKQELRSIETANVASEDLAWDKLFDVHLDMQFSLRASRGQKVPARNIPIICFEDRPSLNEFLTQTRAWISSSGEFNFESYKSGKEALANEDSSGYSYYLAHSFLAALMMDWGLATLLSERAQEVSLEHTDFNPGSSNGREAFYFEAYCRRHVAKSIESSDDLEQLLWIAEDIADIENENSGDRIHDVVPERFKCERIALNLTRLLYEWNQNVKTRSSDVPEALIGLTEEISELAEVLENRIRSLERDEIDLANSDQIVQSTISVEERRVLLEGCLARCRRNLIAIGLQFTEYNNMAQKSWSDLEASLSDQGKGEIECSFFLDVIINCCRARFSEKNKERKASVDRLKYKLLDRVDENKIFPYDKVRYRMMIEGSIPA